MLTHALTWFSTVSSLDNRIMCEFLKAFVGFVGLQVHSTRKEIASPLNLQIFNNFLSRADQSFLSAFPSLQNRRVAAEKGSELVSIAFGGAPRREADSQRISQLVRPAVRQTVSRASRQAGRNTQFGFFFQ